MQIVGKTEAKNIVDALEQSATSATATAAAENAAIAAAGRRMARAASTDVLAAECITNVPSASFPGNELLRREEVETGAHRTL